MDAPFALLQFLTRSENRVTTLLALSERAATRPDLQEETDVPRATLSRILADLRRRELVTREGRRYATTPLGAHLASELRSLFDSIESMRAVQSVSRWLPTDEFGVDLGELADLEVTLPTPVDPMAPVKRAAAVVGDAEHVRGFCYSVVHAPILSELEAVTERNQRFEAVIAAGVFEVVAADPELAGGVQDLLASGNADVSIYEGEIGPQLIIADGSVLFLTTDGEGAIQGLVATADEAIQPWATSTFESYRREAEPLDPDDVSELLAS